MCLPVRPSGDGEEKPDHHDSAVPNRHARPPSRRNARPAKQPDELEETDGAHGAESLSGAANARAVRDPQLEGGRDDGDEVEKKPAAQVPPGEVIMR